MNNLKFQLPYELDPQYSKPVAYFSMEYAIHQPLKIYAGGLGYITGSFLRSAYTLKQNVIGIGILWKHGFYDQGRKNDQTMEVLFQEKKYHFLQETNIKFSININNKDVKVKVYYLSPKTFKTAPLYLLSTDLPENDYWSKSITSKLYDSNLELRTSAKILLGIGGIKVLEALNFNPEIYHINDTDALPLAFYLLNKYKNVKDVKNRLVYTNYNLEEAVNDKLGLFFLEKLNYFNGIPQQIIKDLLNIKGDNFNANLAALSLSKISNGVSKMHANILNRHWKYMPRVCPITHVTLGQNFRYWADPVLYKALDKGNDDEILERKKSMKNMLFEEVAEQTGYLFDENVLTLVWARRFSSYRRPDLLLQDEERLHQLLTNKKYPVQIIFAGKPHPMDYAAISAFDKLVDYEKRYHNLAVLVGHELRLGKLLKGGADIWLNTQKHGNEATETSGISASMNGSINLSTPDGWILEFGEAGKNCFILFPNDPDLSSYQKEKNDSKLLYDMLEQKVLPLYYKEPSKWLEIMKNSMNDIHYFDSDRMGKEYYEKVYNYKALKVDSDEESKVISEELN